MASYPDVLAALPAFRNDLLQQQQDEPLGRRTTFVARGAFSAFATPASNVHAIGAGIRQRRGRYDPDEYVIKVFVFDKVAADELGAEFDREYRHGRQRVPVDVEQLPIQVVRARTESATGETTGRYTRGHRAGEGGDGGERAAATVRTPPQRQRHRPVVGGLSISPINAQYVGTLGCFLRRRRVDADDLFVLSNNHVLADVNRLPRGTFIVQPGPEEQLFTPPADVIASLSGAITVRFPVNPDSPVVNRFDAAIARVVVDHEQVALGEIFGIDRYDPRRIATAVPGMRVIKCGRTTGVTRGIVTATNVDGVQINYGTRQAPRIAVFDDTIEIVGDPTDTSFSLPGDSGSVILEEETGHPTALLFAGDGVHTTACSLGPLCRRLRAWPV
jgi:hypothetical protein